MTPSLNDAIARVYEAALDSMLWSPFLDELAGSFDATSGMLQVQDTRQIRPTEQISSLGFSNSDLVKYADYYCTKDIWTEIGKQKPSGTALWCSEFVPDREFAQSEIWNDYSRFLPASPFYCIGATVTLGRGHVGCLGLHRRKNATNFTPADRNRLQTFLPHYQRALQVRARLEDSIRGEERANAALDCLSTAVIVVRSNATVLFANRAALDIAAQNDGLSLGCHSEGVSGLHGDETRALRASIAGAAATTTGQGNSSGATVCISRKSGHKPYVAIISPMPMRFARQAAALVLLVDTQQAPRLLASILSELFGLTPAEARLAMYIGSGKRPTEAADELAVSHNTVRCQLSNVFAKTSTRRQADLVRLLSLLDSLHQITPR